MNIVVGTHFKLFLCLEGYNFVCRISRMNLKRLSCGRSAAVTLKFSVPKTFQKRLNLLQRERGEKSTRPEFLVHFLI